MSTDPFIKNLKAIVGRRHVLTDPRQSERFRKGFRSGEGEALAVVVPGTLLQLWRVLEACVAADMIIIMQAANTGLTEGSTPSGSYDRDVVIISTLRLDKIHLLEGGKQVVSHAGGTLFTLEKLLKPLGRQPHSVIGSSCIGASIIGGVCNNSGGSLVQRGPVYTELSLFAQLRGDGSLVLVNHLGMRLGDTSEEILGRLDRGEFSNADIEPDAGKGSDNSYPARVRDVEADSPARFNADPDRLHEASGCAGKLAVFAVRLDTFPEQEGEQVYYIGTNDPADLTTLRRRLLKELPELPVSGEYMHREVFDIARVYGKDTLLMIYWLGTDFLPFVFALKGRIDARLNKISVLKENLLDRAMQFASSLLPEALPKRILDYRERYEHHLILKVGPKNVDETEKLLRGVVGANGWFRCDAKEAAKAMLHRFAAAGAAVRYQAIHDDEVEDIIPLDIALRRNDQDWLETLPDDIEKDLTAKLYYGHFFCHVFHQDYIVRKGADPKLIKQKMLALLDHRGAEYPAEHNVGHLYEAKPALASFYEQLDPTNSFNPGIGKTSKQKRVPPKAAHTEA
jgi:D-lactate dehydrogenase